MTPASAESRKERCGWLRLMLYAGWASLFLASYPALASAQEIRLDLPNRPSELRVQRVSLETDTQVIEAGQPAWIELRFHVASGFHINSHTPNDETLIPTSFALSSPASYRVLQTVYPKGIPLHLNIGAGETISTYSDEFRVRLQVLAIKGDSVLAGSLYYQACNAASCFPPRDLTIRVAVTAR